MPALRRYCTTAPTFGDPEFWESFYAKKAGSPFEWFCTYDQARSLLAKQIKPSDRLLHVGCGTSALGNKLFCDGYRQICNVDLDASAIAQMKSLYPEEQYQVASVLQLPFPDEAFDLVLDKGTIDAVIFQQEGNVEVMISELDRVLRPGGRIIQISDDAPEWRVELVKDCLRSLPAGRGTGWAVQYSALEEEEGGGDDSGFEYFMYTFTKGAGPA